jgi:hypothetical protein
MFTAHEEKGLKENYIYIFTSWLWGDMGTFLESYIPKCLLLIISKSRL